MYNTLLFYVHFTTNQLTVNKRVLGLKFFCAYIRLYRIFFWGTVYIYVKKVHVNRTRVPNQFESLIKKTFIY